MKKKTQDIKENVTAKKSIKKEKSEEVISNNKTKTSTKKTTPSKTSSKQANNSTKKVNSKKTVASKTEKKKATNKSSSRKGSSSTKAKKKTTKTTKKDNIQLLEYYDLPYRYNQTIVKLLAQTPTTLFIYWDISDEDRENYKDMYGEDFFNHTKPVLIIHNDTLNYTFEVDINDFANCWYLHVNDSKCKYSVELGRRPINNEEVSIPNNYLYITSSNVIESPNDHILFEKSQNTVYFRNVKNNRVTSKDISNISFIRNMGKIYNIYDLYKKIYKDENIESFKDLSNPSSANPTSSFMINKGEI